MEYEVAFFYAWKICPCHLFSNLRTEIPELRVQLHNSTNFTHVFSYILLYAFMLRVFTTIPTMLPTIFKEYYLLYIFSNIHENAQGILSKKSSNEVLITWKELVNIKLLGVNTNY